MESLLPFPGAGEMKDLCPLPVQLSFLMAHRFSEVAVDFKICCEGSMAVCNYSAPKKHC